MVASNNNCRVARLKRVALTTEITFTLHAFLTVQIDVHGVVRLHYRIEPSVQTPVKMHRSVHPVVKHITTVAVVAWVFMANGAELLTVTAGHSDAHATLQKKTVNVESVSTLDLQFDEARVVFMAKNAVIELQDAYAATLEPGETPEFYIREQNTGHYFYVNKDKRRTDLEEITRTSTPSSAEAIYFLSSERWFGRFDAVVHFQAQSADDGRVACRTRLYAYPHVGPVRFFVRRLNLIERFFAKKTTFFENLLTDTFREACRRRTLGIAAE